MPANITGKTIWVIGASSGIGYALSKSLLSETNTLIISARRQERLTELASLSPRIIPLPLDLTADEAVLTRTAEKAATLTGKIDIIIFCAGLSQRTSAEATPLNNTRKIMETNFFSSVTLTRALLPLMKKSGGGRFVIISSLMGRFGARQRSSYAASKHALHGYFESLRAEEWKNNIRVTLAILGYINTEFSRSALTESGEPYNQTDNGQQQGMSATECAQKIIRGICQDKEELLIGGREKYATFLKRFAPRLLSRILRNRNIN